MSPSPVVSLMASEKQAGEAKPTPSREHPPSPRILWIASCSHGSSHYPHRLMSSTTYSRKAVQPIGIWSEGQTSDCRTKSVLDRDFQPGLNRTRLHFFWMVAFSVPANRQMLGLCRNVWDNKRGSAHSLWDKCAHSFGSQRDTLVAKSTYVLGFSKDFEIFCLSGITLLKTRRRFCLSARYSQVSPASNNH